MTPWGFIIFENVFVFGRSTFKHFQKKYNDYMLSNEIKVKPYNKGLGVGPVLLFVFLSSCLLYNVDASSFIIDYAAEKPYMIEFILCPWDTFWSARFIVIHYTPIAGYYKAENPSDFEQGDWGLPFDLKIHQCFIIIWWLWFIKKVALNLFRQVKDFFLLDEKSNS